MFIGCTSITILHIKYVSCGACVLHRMMNQRLNNFILETIRANTVNKYEPNPRSLGGCDHLSSLNAHVLKEFRL